MIVSVLFVGCLGGYSSKHRSIAMPECWKDVWIRDGFSARPWETATESRKELFEADNTCRIEALKVPVPSPACSSPPTHSCGGLTGWQLAVCQTEQERSPRCDYSSVDAAVAAQREVHTRCMALRGWRVLSYRCEEVPPKLDSNGFSGLPAKECSVVPPFVDGAIIECPQLGADIRCQVKWNIDSCLAYCVKTDRVSALPDLNGVEYDFLAKYCVVSSQR